MRNRLFKLFKANKGGFAIEAAIVLPFIILLSFGTINISRYVLTQGALSKASDSLANLLALSLPYDDTIDLAEVTDPDNYDYLTKAKLDTLVNTSIPLLLRGYDTSLGTKTIVTSVHRETGDVPKVQWQEDYVNGMGDSLGGSYINNLDSPDPRDCVGVCKIAREMTEGESVIIVEVYQDFIPSVMFGGNVPVIGRSAIYSGTAYSPRFGELKCLYPNPSPYAGQC